MFGSIGPTELMVIMALALLFFGPKALPEIGRSLGNALRELRRASNTLMDTINHPDLLLDDDDRTARDERPAYKPIEFPEPPPMEYEDDPATFETQPYGSEFRLESEAATASASESDGAPVGDRPPDPGPSA